MTTRMAIGALWMAVCAMAFLGLMGRYGFVGTSVIVGFLIFLWSRIEEACEAWPRVIELYRQRYRNHRGGTVAKNKQDKVRIVRKLSKKEIAELRGAAEIMARARQNMLVVYKAVLLRDPDGAVIDLEGMRVVIPPAGPAGPPATPPTPNRP